MISFSLSELCIFANYKLSGEDKQINKVSTDSRDCKDALFVALVGERFDGHDFIAKAIENGAVAVLCSKVVNNLPNGTSAVLCDDTQKALGYCSYLVRRKFKGAIASLTGSCGKTTVKEFTNSILSENGNSMCTFGNFNNDIGVPLTLLRLDNTYDFAVVEQGASHLYDIAHTCEFLKADTALINNVGSAHIEGFGSQDGVYHGKSEILDDVLSRGKKAVVPSDSPYADRWRSDFAAAFRSGNLLTFGTNDNDFVKVSSIKQNEDSLSFDITTQESSFSTTMNVIGLHNAYNAAAACALSLISGAKNSTLKTGLEKASSLKGRLTVTNHANMTVIDDAYNASYNAVIAGIDTLSAYKGHRVLVFGDMGELGDSAVSLHEKVGEYALAKVDEILCVGELSKSTCSIAKQISKHFKNREDLVKYALTLIGRYEHVTFLVKGSHSMHMDEIVERINKSGERTC